VSRRSFLKTLGVAGAATTAPAFLRSTAEAQETLTPARDPAAKRGGTLRYGVHTAPAHFDVHQSGTVANIGAQSPMYDTLIRRDPRDGQTIIPDLAFKWDVAPDGKKYTFHLRKGVSSTTAPTSPPRTSRRRTSGSCKPPKGILIPRSSLFHRGERDRGAGPAPHRVPAHRAAAAAFMLGAFASGWNIIVRKKTLDDNQGNLRQVMNYPGTGPFRHVSRKDKEVWNMEKNPNYWNKGLPYVDKLEVYHMPPFSPELGAAFLSGKLDYARLMDPVSWRKAEMPGSPGRLQPAGPGGLHNQEDGLQDVRCAGPFTCHDRHVLDVVKTPPPCRSAASVSVPQGPKGELRRSSYQKDRGASRRPRSS
jgi:ABC-type transport system substrate-binding protein